MPATPRPRGKSLVMRAIGLGAGDDGDRDGHDGDRDADTGPTRQQP
ncbi:hypothetical protein Hbl1158_05890 [Halobaculum sp. CBA1158]|nr:hypothetical protein [Halobaculum sp. CBA1158]UIP00887.1 hypothetical protein Hbl1158_05890 [Halobaculum sp. CBA1158]